MIRVVGALVVVALAAARADAQPVDRLRDMPTIAAALGVTCAYCHPGRGNEPTLTASGKSRQEVAREMIAMTEALNATVRAATGKAATDAVSVQCITCHRGVPIPRQLVDVLWPTTVRQGGAAGAAQYRELRAQFHGRQAYDFGEETLITIAQRIGQARPADAVTLMETNLEFFPRSTRSLIVLATAQSRSDAAAAVAALKKVLELEPENSEAKGRLYQLEQQVERQRRLRE
jgi:hypothetical protein